MGTCLWHAMLMHKHNVSLNQDLYLLRIAPFMQAFRGALKHFAIRDLRSYAEQDCEAGQVNYIKLEHGCGKC